MQPMQPKQPMQPNLAQNTIIQSKQEFQNWDQQVEHVEQVLYGRAYHVVLLFTP